MAVDNLSEQALDRGGPAGDLGWSVCAIIPAFNEAGAIRGVVESLRRYDPSITAVVVNDASTDETALRAQEADATVINLPVNLGIGGAVQTGFLYAREHGYSVAIQVDGDGQHPPEEVYKLLEPIKKGDADIVVGSRWVGPMAYVSTVGRRSGMILLAFLITRRIRHKVTDTTSGFRAYNQKAIELFSVDYPTDYPEVQSLVLATRHRLRVAEVAVSMRQRMYGRSSINGFKPVYYMLRVILALFVDLMSGATS